MTKRRSFKEIEAAARKSEREDCLAEACRILKHHMGNENIADRLWDLMRSPEPKRQVWASVRDGFEAARK